MMRKIYVLFFLVLCASGASAQLYWNTNGVSNTLTATNWGTVPAGPFTTAWTNGSNINFTANSLITNVTTIPVGNFTIINGSTVTWTAAGTYSTGAGVRTFDIGASSTLTWNGQTISTAAGTGFIKNGTGVWNIGAQANAFTGGFTLNAGTIIIGGTNAIGTGALTINGGVICPNSAAARTPNVSGTTIGGDFQFGDAVNFAAFTGNLTLANAISLGAVTRTITIGNTGTYTLGGVVSGSAAAGLTVNSISTGVLNLTNVNTYPGTTTVNSGELRLNPSGNNTLTGSFTLNGGKLATTGIAATRSVTYSTLNLTDNSTIALGTNAHSLNFANSSAVSWTGGKTLTITGWVGGYNGTAGATQRIFVGTDATGLTAGQLAQITFRDGSNNPFPAVILSTGEVVPGTAVTVPDITLSSPNPAVAAGNISQGTTNNVIYRFDLAVATANATLTGVTINTAGTYAATDFTNFRCWYSADNVFNTPGDVLLSTITPTVAGPQAFTPFTNQTINNGSTGFIFITASVPCITSVIGNNISVNAITTADITFTSGNKTGSAFAGGLQTIIAATPNDVTTPAASVANASSSLSWVNPAGCYDEVLIVAAANTNNSGIPTGDGTAYTGNLTFAAGTPLGNGFVVYKGATSPQVVNGLTNGIPYFYKFFTRLGTIWSAGVEVSATPVLASAATDYFRSVASGDWNTLATWQSSADSATWIAATLVPGATAAHVVIQSPDSVYLTIALTTTQNLTVLSGGIINANANTLALTNRLNLLGTAAFYQGGTTAVVPGVTRVLSTTSNYHFNGTQNGASGAFPEFGNLFWEPAATGNGTLQNTLTIAPANLGLLVRGNMTINIQGATPREVRFGTGSSVLRRHVIDGNLNIIGANTITVIQNGTIGAFSYVSVGGNINVNGGTLTGVNSTAPGVIYLSGNINNTGGIIQTGGGAASFSINYVGTGAQSINNTGGTFTFTANQKDTVNKPSGTLTLNTPITHNGTIEFISGVVTTTAANLLTMGAGSTVIGASNTSYVNGPVKKIGNTDFTFPVGKANGYVPIRVSNFTGLSAPTDEFTAEYIRASGNALGANLAVPPVNRISACEYWNLNLNNGTPTVDLTLYWNANNPCNGAYISNVADIEVVHFNGTVWNTSSVGFSSKTGTTAAGDVTWTNVSVFSPFTLASSTNANPLPIVINYLNGTKNNGNHLLNWKATCVSVPSVTIDLQRSTDGRNYSSIYSIFATALRCQQPFDYTDNQPAKGINYYRLKITDADGKVTYSSIVSLINAVKGIDVMNIAPNPIVNSTFNLKVSAAAKTKMDIVITDMQGRILQQQSVNLIAGFNSIPMNAGKLAAGTYQLVGNTDEGKTKVLRFVIQ